MEKQILEAMKPFADLYLEIVNNKRNARLTDTVYAFNDKSFTLNELRKLAEAYRSLKAQLEG